MLDGISNLSRKNWGWGTLTALSLSYFTILQKLVIQEVTLTLGIGCTRHYKKIVYVCIFLDFAEAFDTINQVFLLKKLEHDGIRGVAQQWLKSYLSNSMQCTETGDTQSELEIKRWGVPQRSVLGSLFFLIYINHIVK